MLMHDLEAMIAAKEARLRTRRGRLAHRAAWAVDRAISRADDLLRQAWDLRHGRRPSHCTRCGAKQPRLTYRDYPQARTICDGCYQSPTSHRMNP